MQPSSSLSQSAVNSRSGSSQNREAQYAAGGATTEDLARLQEYVSQPSDQRQQSLDAFLLEAIHDDSFKRLVMDLENSSMRIGLG